MHLAASRTHLSKDRERQVRQKIRPNLPLPPNLGEDSFQIANSPRQLVGYLSLPRAAAAPRKPKDGDKLDCEIDVLLDFRIVGLVGTAERGNRSLPLLLSTLFPKLFGDRLGTRHMRLLRRSSKCCRGGTR